MTRGEMMLVDRWRDAMVDRCQLKGESLREGGGMRLRGETTSSCTVMLSVLPKQFHEERCASAFLMSLISL